MNSINKYIAIILGRHIILLCLTECEKQIGLFTIHKKTKNYNDIFFEGVIEVYSITHDKMITKQPEEAYCLLQSSADNTHYS